MSSCAICGWFLEAVPTQIVASISTNAAIVTRGAGINHAHQLCFTGSAATRARTRKSNAAVGSIIGSSSNNPLTARNSFTRRQHAAHPARCFSTSSRSFSLKRPSTYPRILFSIRPQLMTSPSLPNCYDFPCCATRGASSTRSVSRSEEHTSELQSRLHLVCRLLLEKKTITYIAAVIAYYLHPVTLPTPYLIM